MIRRPGRIEGPGSPEPTREPKEVSRAVRKTSETVTEAVGPIFSRSSRRRSPRIVKKTTDPQVSKLANRYLVTKRGK